MSIPRRTGCGCRRDRLQMPDRRQHDLGGKRKRGDGRPGCNRAVIGSVRNAARQIAVEQAANSIDLELGGARPFARGDAPAMLAVSRKTVRVVDRVELLDLSRPPAVLEVIDAPAPHELVLDSSKIDPDVRELVDE